MENKKIYNDDVERIVNDPERQEAINAFHEKRAARRQRKMLADACVYLAFALAFGALGVLGWMFNWIAYPVCAVCGLYSAFLTGRWFENGKCLGWR
jgi:fatty acid desaturase